MAVPTYRQRIEAHQTERLRAAAASPGLGGMFGVRPLGPRAPRVTRFGLIRNAVACVPMGAVLALATQSHLAAGAPSGAWAAILGALHVLALGPAMRAALTGVRRTEMTHVALDLAAGYALVTAAAMVVAN